MTTCATCGAAGSGNFCSSCGAPLTAGPGRRPPAAGPRDRTPWIVAGLALAGMLGLLLFTLVRRAPVQPDAVAALPGAAVEAGESPPDLSSMSPRERFNRLYNRIMRGAEAGDEATVTRFTPMALMAYAQLDTIDADARFHAALLQVHTGNSAAARALGDSVLVQNPGHLFGYMILGTVARWDKDDAALRRAYAGFLEHYDAEMKAGREEYSEHTTSVNDFRQAALDARAKPAGS